MRNEGLIVTNDHVLEHANDITVTLTDGRTLKAKRIGGAATGWCSCGSATWQSSGCCATASRSKFKRRWRNATNAPE
jgi:hypothetical protein